MEWNVYRISNNRDDVETFNVFNHFSFLEGCAKAASKKEVTKEEFSDKIKSELFYYFGSKCEWEILIKNWLTRDDIKARKVDVREQIMINYDHFLDYVWNNRSELLKQYRAIKRESSKLIR